MGDAVVRAPAAAAIPDGPLGDAIRRGKLIVTQTYETLPEHVGSRLHCTSCHLEEGTRAGAASWVGLPIARLEALAGTRVGMLTRLGDGMIPEAATVLQDGDLLHVMASIDDVPRLERVFGTTPPHE